MVQISKPSVQSLLLKLLRDGQPISSATGFVASRQGSSYLVTNRHVFTGRHQDTGRTLDTNGATPQEVQIVHNSKSGLCSWSPKIERLYDTDIEPLWLEHGEFGAAVDVVALPLTKLDGIETHPYNPWQSEPDVDIKVASELYIIGFPFGITAGGAFGVWSRGSIASEPDLDMWNLPRFLVDSRTRPGQSGSPVVYHSAGGTLPIRGKGLYALGETTRFFGVYSGRVNEQSDLGYVWKQSVVAEILSSGRRTSYTALQPK